MAKTKLYYFLMDSKLYDGVLVCGTTTRARYNNKHGRGRALVEQKQTCFPLLQTCVRRASI